MKYLILLLLTPTFAIASVVGISTHPLSEEARVLSAEMTGYMSQRHEMGAGLRYTQGVGADLFDVSVAGAQDSRALSAGAGYDIALLREDVNQPRVSVKPFVQRLTFEEETSTHMGIAPTLRKGISFAGHEFFPYLALPNGMRLDNEDQDFVFSSALTIGGSMTVPRSEERLVLTLEANKDLGASSDSVGALVSWIWN